MESIVQIVMAIFMFLCLVLLTLPLLYRYRNSKHYILICMAMGWVCYFAMKLLAPEVRLSKYVLIMFPLLIVTFMFYEWFLNRNIRGCKEEELYCVICKEREENLIDFDVEGRKIKICEKCLKVIYKGK